MLTSYFLLKIRQKNNEINAVEQILLDDQIRDNILKKYGKKRRYRKRGQQSSNIWKERLKEYFEKNKIEFEKVVRIFEIKSKEFLKNRPEFIEKMKGECLSTNELKKYVETKKIIFPANLATIDMNV